MLHKEILTKEQVELLPLVSGFSKKFGMVGGTAIALYIGHRESIDFDLFSLEEFDNAPIQRKILKYRKIEEIIRDETGQYTMMIRGVRFTFFHYLYPIKFSKNFDDVIAMPDLLTLAAMKIFALGRRAKWKDYVDLYFILKNRHSLKEIFKKAKQIFGNEFNEKLARTQLAYFHDIDYREKIKYLEGFAVRDEAVEKDLTQFSLN
ncbi:nucleotidyl transferase AbiEii/AbiGii toxin family protein [Candidatus Wolfebacteria bacterium]|nr:nucleotidyl transferase AbiEii/AbiGii toxin family protein [Candidatus Wolfebacteria bacterium]